MFNKVSNVSLSCEDDDYTGKCQFNCTFLPRSQMCTFVFNQVTNVSIERLAAGYQKVNTAVNLTVAENITKYLNISTTVSKHCHSVVGVHRSWVFIESTDITVSRADFIGPQNSWAVVRPRGRFTISNCSFTNLSSGLSEYDPLTTSTGQHHITVIVEESRHLPPLVFTIENTSFKGQHYLPFFCHNTSGGNYPVVHLCSDSPLKGWSVNFTIQNCKFIKCPALQVHAEEDPRLHINVAYSEINGGVSQKTAYHWLRNCSFEFTSPAVHVQLNNSLSGCQLQERTSPQESMGTFKIAFSSFTRVAGGKVSAVSVRLRAVKNSQHAMQVILYNNTFRDNHGIYHRSLVFVRHSTLDNGNDVTKCGQQSVTGFSYPLKIEGNIFKHNFGESKLDYFCAILTRLHNKFLIVNADVDMRKFFYHYKYTCYRLGVIYLSGLEGIYRVLFKDNVIRDNKVTGLTLYSSHVEMVGTNIVRYNLGYYGGGIRMNARSLLLLRNDTSLEVVQNQAYFSGGGFYILDQCTLNISFTHCPCFFQLVHHNGSYISRLSKDELKVLVNVSDNRAFNKGKGSASVIFNSNIDQCYLETNVTGVTRYAEVFREVFDITGPVNNLNVSSIPRRICAFCKNDTCLSEGTNQTLEYYHGQHLSTSVLVEGDMGIPLSGVLYVDLVCERYRNTEKDFFPPELHSTHILEDKCNQLLIPALPEIPQHCTNGTQFSLQLRIALFTGTTVLNEGRYLYTSIRTRHLKGCPSGFHAFNFSERHRDCKCSQHLENDGLTCSLDKLSIKKPSNITSWIGKNGGQIMWSLQCPHSRCNSSIVNIPINNTDMQCMYNRTGVLCGRCPDGLSTLIGSSQCSDTCSNWNLLLLLVLLIGGPLFVILIGALNMTITVGAINGFMFYVTVVAINKMSLDSYPFLYKDIKICLYSEQDEFGKTLVSYLFPLYLLLLFGIACLLPKCKCINMHKIHKKIGPRITPVLATVITVSYLFMSEATIKILLYAEVKSTNGSNMMVWLYDGSLEYFKSTKHIVLGCIATISLLFFLLPAMVVATFGDLLRRFIKGPYYMNFLDTFHGAFRFRFGFWFGVRLIILTIIMVLRILLPLHQMNIAIICLSTCILVFQMIVKPYRGIRIEECVTDHTKRKYFLGSVPQDIANILDNLFQINLIVLFASALNSDKQNDNSWFPAIFTISQLAVCLKFLIILIYHLLEYTPLGQYLIERMQRVKRKYNRWKEERMLRAREERNRLEEEPVKNADIELWLGDCVNSDSDDESNSDVDEYNRDVCAGSEATVVNAKKVYRYDTNSDVSPLLMD